MVFRREPRDVTHADASANALEILWEDPHLLVVNKPGGLLTQPRGPKVGEPSLEDAVRAYLSPDRPSDVYLGTIHRLDRPVSGVVVWAKHPKAARRVSKQFERRSVGKLYAAAIEADPSAVPEEEEWSDWLGPVGPSGVAVISETETPETRHALTRATRMTQARFPTGIAGVWLYPKTGRTHQLRAQSARRGRPIVGDAAYGSKQGFPRGIALHARSLVVHHPALEKRMVFEAPWPWSWVEAGFDLSREPDRSP
jgi:23S rRNA pseudouridine1911/1915/1917 synthase